MKVLYLVSTLQKAGPTSQLYYIISNLVADIKPILVTLSPEPAQSRLDDFKALGISHYQLNLSRFGGMFLAKGRVREIIEKELPDVIHSQGFRGDMLASDFAEKVPVVCTVRNFPQLDFPMTYGRVTGNIMAYRQIRALHKVSRVCAVSDAVKANLQQTYALTNAATVLNGVDTQKFYPADAKQKSVLRKQYGINENSRVWISSLGKDSRKNSVTVASAFKLFLALHPDDTLIFIGDGQQRYECEEIATDNPQFKFFGKVSNVSDYLQMADYFVSASRAEGMPNAVLEAMACGLPSVLSDIAPHQEIHALNPDGCVVFETESANDLHDTFTGLVKVERQHMADVTSAVVNQYFSSKSMSAKYQQLYRELTQ
ncbi:glycosyltransferase [Bermanella sp. R86510]|uniref:glycosyltransferase n=1 Tax=unclassified Bermanella TaxID=2627862 RepID=UPI0037C8F954